MTRIGLVLGAGGLVGHAWHCGVLAALADETGWDPRDADFVVGTSAGAGIASYLRAGLGSQELFERLHQLDGSRSQRRLAAIDGADDPEPEPSPGRRRPLSPSLALRSIVAPWRTRVGVVLTGLVPAGRRSTAPIATWSAELHGDTWPTRPLWLCAVDVATGRRVVFGRDTDLPSASVAEAVEASCAVPGVFRPVEIGGRRFVDGGVHSPTNADVLVGRAVDTIVVSSPMSASSGTGRIGTRAYHHRLLESEAGRLRAAGAEVTRFEPSSEVVAELQRARGAGPDALAAVARAARRSVADHLRRADVRGRLAALNEPGRTPLDSALDGVDSAGTTDFR